MPGGRILQEELFKYRCNNGIWDSDLNHHLYLMMGRTSNRIFRKTLELEIKN
jgi:hypothetical protein